MFFFSVACDIFTDVCSVSSPKCRRHKVRNTKKREKKIKINTNKRLTNMLKQIRVFVKDVNARTEYVASRNAFARGTGLKITMNRKYRVVPDTSRRNTKAH
jgi:hypothetical protein